MTSREQVQWLLESWSLQRWENGPPYRSDVNVEIIIKFLMSRRCKTDFFGKVHPANSWQNLYIYNILSRNYPLKHRISMTGNFNFAPNFLYFPVFINQKS